MYRTEWQEKGPREKKFLINTTFILVVFNLFFLWFLFQAYSDLRPILFLAASVVTIITGYMCNQIQERIQNEENFEKKFFTKKIKPPLSPSGDSVDKGGP